MEIIQWLSYIMIPVCIVSSILLMIYGKNKHIKYLDPKVPLGRLFYFLGNSYSIMCCVLLIVFVMTGMRRAYDIGFPYWIYPIFIIITLLSSLINKEISEFLGLGMYIFLLQPGERRE